MIYSKNERSNTMGAIGPHRKTIEVEPFPQTAPADEPVAPAPEREPEVVPA